MFITRIGKQKHKYKFKFILNKATFQPSKSKKSNQESQIRVKFTRGSHQVIIDSIRVKKNVARFDKKEYIIPVTLFYDQDNHRYMEKQAQIKIYEIDQLANSRKIGTNKLNLAQYAEQGRLAVQLELDSISQDQASPVLTFELLMERQDDDDGIETSSANTDNQFNFGNVKTKTRTQYNRSENGDNSREPRSKLKKNKSPKKEPFVESQQTTIKTRTPSHDKLKLKLQQLQQQSKFNFQNTKKPIQKQKQQIIMKTNKIQDLNNNQKYTQENTQTNKIKAAQFNPQNKLSDLQIYVLKKSVAEKDKQILSLKNQNQNYKRTISKLTQEKYQRQKKDSTANFGIVQRYQQQINNYKKWLVQRQLKIGQADSQLNQYKKRQTENEKTILKQRKQLTQIKQKLQKCKYNIAQLMQRCFQTGNKDLIAFVSQIFQNQQD